jgi:hypothetical protein
MLYGASPKKTGAASQATPHSPRASARALAKCTTRIFESFSSNYSLLSRRSLNRAGSGIIKRFYLIGGKGR